MNYLQYIRSVYQPEYSGNDIRYLVSGVDFRVRQVLGQYIVNSIYEADRILFILDSTQSGSAFTDFGGFRVANPLNGDVNLCYDLLEVSSLKEISRLRSLLTDLGFDGTKAMKVISYLSFVKETERRLGNNSPLSIEILEEHRWLNGNSVSSLRMECCREKAMNTYFAVMQRLVALRQILKCFL